MKVGMKLKILYKNEHSQILLTNANIVSNSN